jgi:hypothetical protein
MKALQLCFKRAALLHEDSLWRCVIGPNQAFTPQNGLPHRWSSRVERMWQVVPCWVKMLRVMWWVVWMEVGWVEGLVAFDR